LSIEQLCERMPVLRQRQQALTAELQAIADQTNDRAAFLRLAETLTAFLARLRSAAETLSVIERQKIVRLLVKDVLVGEDTIAIRHSIPIPSSPPQNEGSGSSDGRNYLLCKGRGHYSVRRYISMGGTAGFAQNVVSRNERKRDNSLLALLHSSVYEWLYGAAPTGVLCQKAICHVPPVLMRLADSSHRRFVTPVGAVTVPSFT